MWLSKETAYGTDTYNQALALRKAAWACRSPWRVMIGQDKRRHFVVL